MIILAPNPSTLFDESIQSLIKNCSGTLNPKSCQAIKIFLHLIAVFTFVVLSTSPASATKVVVFIWDGCNYFLARDLYQGGHLPNLRSLGPLGQMTAIVPCYESECMVSNTIAQHATLVTGVHADIHREFMGGPGPGTPLPRGITIYEKLRQAIPTIKIAHISMKSTNFGGMRYKWVEREAADVFLFEITLRPSIENAVLISFDTLRQFENSSVNDYFVVVNLGEPDSIGNEYYIFSNEYKNTIIQLDDYLGQYLRIIDPNTHVFVLGDHGQGEVRFMTGVAKPGSHIQSPTTIYVRRGSTSPERVFMDDMMGIWLDLFGLSVQ
jgi:hypothetical protein